MTVLAVRQDKSDRMHSGKEELQRNNHDEMVPA